MTEMKELTPWIMGLLALAVGWLFKTVIQLGKDVVAIQTAFSIYLDRTSKGAAKVLDSPNPTPEDMRVLLRKFYQNNATDAEKEELRVWLRSFVDDPGHSKAERSAAIDILAAMRAMQALPRHRTAHGHY